MRSAISDWNTDHSPFVSKRILKVETNITSTPEEIAHAIHNSHQTEAISVYRSSSNNFSSLYFHVHGDRIDFGGQSSCYFHRWLPLNLRVCNCAVVLIEIYTHGICTGLAFAYHTRQFGVVLATTAIGSRSDGLFIFEAANVPLCYYVWQFTSSVRAFPCPRNAAQTEYSHDGGLLDWCWLIGLIEMLFVKR